MFTDNKSSSPTFRLGCTSDRIWNYVDLVRWLSNNQHRDITIAIDPEAICLHSLGLYDLLDSFKFGKVEIITANPFEFHERYSIVSIPFYTWMNLRPKIDSNLWQWNQKKIFFCLFGRPTAARLGIASWLRHHHAAQCHLHFSAAINDDAIEQFELDKLLTYDTALVKLAGKMIPDLPLLLGSSQNYTAFAGYDYNDTLTQLYQDIFVDVVVESHVKGRTFFPTEKVVRSMWMKKPFVVFASRDFLDYLHQMGFRSFSDFWPEIYDGYEGKDRMIRIITLLDSLAQKTTDELFEMYMQMQFTLDHNYNLLKFGEFNRSVELINE